MSTDTALDVCVLEELDFPVACGHSQHGHDETGRHGGEATFVAVSYHSCKALADHPSPYYYPCCTDFALFVQHAHATDRQVQCHYCGESGYWSDLVAIVGTL